MTLKKKYIAFSLIGLLGLLIGWRILLLFMGAPPPQGRGEFPVVVTEAKWSDFKDAIEAIGTAQANESVELTANVTETISKIHFQEGQYVEKGTVIVELLADEEKAALEEAEKQFKRIEGLTQTQAATLTRRDEQLLELEVARAKLNDRRIQVPFSGTLGLRKVSEGALVTPGTVITTLDDISVIKLLFSIPERYLSELSIGQRIEALSVAYPKKVFEGSVYAWDPRVDPSTRSISVKALIPNPDSLLKPGMLLNVNVVINDRETVLLPEEALVVHKGEQFVYIVKEDNTLERRSVELGRRLAGSVELLSGVLPGERVVIEGSPFLQPGAPVKIVATKTIEDSAQEFRKLNE